MITPKPEDVGRKVIYHGRAGERGEGVITSYNDHYVFVRYGAGVTSAATKYSDLEWAFAKRERA